ncbi:MAG: hypothetical protein OEZ01_15210, partial [Candidatus Heimdallarchaeota archaeon]|nr:hypothetical protein [Candidatus Heimdallarchaeota archaeon]
IFVFKGGFIQVLIIEIDNVELSRNFSGLKIFANEQIRKKTMTEAIRSDNIFIKSIAYFLYKEELIALSEAEGKSISPTSLSIKSAVETIGLSKVIEEVGLTKVMEEVGLNKVIEEVGLNKVIEEVGIEMLFKHLTEEQMDQLIKLRKEQKK